MSGTRRRVSELWRRAWQRSRIRAPRLPPKSAQARVAARVPNFAPFLAERSAKWRSRERAGAANEAHSSAERVELLGLASVYKALADYVDRRHEHGTAHSGDQDQG